jgi:hypothetical protein
MMISYAQKSLTFLSEKSKNPRNTILIYRTQAEHKGYWWFTWGS